MAPRCVLSRNVVREEAIAPLEGCKIQTHYGLCSASRKKINGSLNNAYSVLEVTASNNELINNESQERYGLIGDNIPELPQGTTDNHAREDREYSGQDESLETPEHEIHFFNKYTD